MDVNNKGKWKPTTESLDSHQAPEWLPDAKFGVFIDWGLWSVAGWAPKKEKGAMYPDWYEFRMDTDSAFKAYHKTNWGEDFKRDDFIPFFQARKYHPGKLIRIAKEAGMKYVVPFNKHHSGFCLWSSSFTQRDAGDYLIPQAAEFIDRYDPNLIWYDGQWLTDVDETKTYEPAAYFYKYQ